MTNNSTVHLLGNAGQPETHNSSDRGEWVRETPIRLVRAYDTCNTVKAPTYDARPSYDQLAARVAELEQRLGSPTDQVVCCHTRFGAPCSRWTTRVNAEANWAYVGACYYCPQCWGHICAGAIA